MKEVALTYKIGNNFGLPMQLQDKWLLVWLLSLALQVSSSGLA